MAGTDVSVSVGGGGIPNVVATGVEITYAVNTIPVCRVKLDPVQSSGLISNSDQYKRQGIANITVQVKGRSGVSFSGLFDGISVSQSVGGLSYEAIFKGQQQLLLETNSLFPGISPYGVRALTPINGITANGTGDPDNVLTQFGTGTLAFDASGMSLAEVYQKIALQSLKNETGSGSSYIPTNPRLQAESLPGVLNNPSRIQKLQAAIDLLEGNFDVSKLQALGSVVSSANIDIGTQLLRQFVTGPASLWENLMAFYETIGCLMIPSNSQVIVVPNNGFVRVNNSGGNSGQQSSTPNYGYPGDYNAFGYNDVGYVDVGYVALISQLPTPHDGSVPLPVYQGGYPAQGGTSSSPGAALLIMDVSPLLTVAPTTFGDPVSSADQSQAHTPGKQSNLPDPQQISSFDQPITKKQQVTDKRLDSWSSVVNKYGDNQAQIKYLQARYGDRSGSITLRFSPNWCPGTPGGIAINQPSGIFLNFMVQSVTHRVEVNPMSQGTAVTCISYNCGRIGSSPESVDQDLLYNYNSGDVSSVQGQFIGDISA